MVFEPENEIAYQAQKDLLSRETPSPLKQLILLKPGKGAKK